MCLAVPAQVLSVQGDEAIVSLNGVKLTVCKALTPDLAPGDYALVHVGFALSRIDPVLEAETVKTLLEAVGGGTP